MNRREFLKKTAVLTAGMTGLALIVSKCHQKDSSLNLEIGVDNLNVDGVILSNNTLSINYINPSDTAYSTAEIDTTSKKEIKEKYNIIIQYTNDTITTNNSKLYNKLQKFNAGDSVDITLSATYILKKDEFGNLVKKCQVRLKYIP